MKRYGIGLYLWGMVILLGVGIGVQPYVQRSVQKQQSRELIQAYLQGQTPSKEQLQGEIMLGVLWIPKIECLLPIWEGCHEPVLQRGAGRLEGSSMISAEMGVHVVLCAHSGLPEMEAFDHIDLLTEGDRIYIFCQKMFLVYAVTQQCTVVPEEVHLLLQPSQFANEITLLTCTPYGINTHRLLVQAKLSRSYSGSAA